MAIGSTSSAEIPNGRQFRFAIAVSEFNTEITGSLLSQCAKTLEQQGVDKDAIDIVRVPGAFELPLTCLTLAKSKRYHGVIALGCIIRGQTPHDRYIAHETARGLGQAAIETGVPVIFGVLTPLTLRQARERAGSGKRNKGREVAVAALRMADLMKTLTKAAPTTGA